MKKLMKILVISCCFVLSVIVINASESGFKRGPTLKLDIAVNGPVHELTSSSGTALVSNSGIYFSELGFLEDGYAKLPRDFPIWLYDEDEALNPDDKLKTYEGMFNYDYTTLHSIDYIGTNSSDVIDSEGDNTAELYIKARLMSVAGDSNKLTTELFYYNLVLR